MGRNKLLLQLGNESLVRRVVARALESGASPVIVVVGHDQDSVRSEIDGMPCTVVVNPDWDRPSSESLHCGLRALPAGVDAVLIVLADMPLVTGSMTHAVVHAAASRQEPLVVSR
ncbi:MAG: nucleotidyltransferase family protein, partial [Gemmatimonadales bacterium]